MNAEQAGVEPVQVRTAPKMDYERGSCIFTQRQKVCGLRDVTGERDVGRDIKYSRET